MGRRSSVKSVLRYYVVSSSEHYPEDLYVLDRDRVWRRVHHFNYLNALLFEDKDEADRFTIQLKLRGDSALWTNATVAEDWVEL